MIDEANLDYFHQIQLLYLGTLFCLLIISTCLCSRRLRKLWQPNSTDRWRSAHAHMYKVLLIWIRTSPPPRGSIESWRRHCPSFFFPKLYRTCFKLFGITVGCTLKAKSNTVKPKTLDIRSVAKESRLIQMFAKKFCIWRANKLSVMNKSQGKGPEEYRGIQPALTTLTLYGLLRICFETYSPFSRLSPYF